MPGALAELTLGAMGIITAVTDVQSITLCEPPFPSIHDGNPWACGLALGATRRALGDEASTCVWHMYAPWHMYVP